jgi:hypothetical protein
MIAEIVISQCVRNEIYLPQCFEMLSLHTGIFLYLRVHAVWWPYAYRRGVHKIRVLAVRTLTYAE